MVLSSGDALLTIINDILDLSKIEAGKLELEHAEFDLSEAVDAAVELLSEQARGKGLELRAFIERRAPRRVMGDRFRLQQVVTNLLSNAVKFTSEGGITVRVTEGEPTRRGQRVRFEVADTGIGIEPAAVARLFEPFNQADSSTTRTYGGTGLGLSICSELVEMMGGEIGAHGEPGRGSTFWFTADLALPEPDGRARARRAGAGARRGRDPGRRRQRGQPHGRRRDAAQARPPRRGRQGRRGGGGGRGGRALRGHPHGLPHADHGRLRGDPRDPRRRGRGRAHGDRGDDLRHRRQRARRLLRGRHGRLPRQAGERRGAERGDRALAARDREVRPRPRGVEPADERHRRGARPASACSARTPSASSRRSPTPCATATREAVARAAHALKGSSGQLGAARTESIAAQLQAVAETGELGSAKALLRRLETAVDAAQSALSSALPEENGSK